MIRRIISDNASVTIEKHSDESCTIQIECKNRFGSFEYGAFSNLPKDVLIELLEVISRMK